VAPDDESPFSYFGISGFGEIISNLPVNKKKYLLDFIFNGPDFDWYPVRTPSLFISDKFA
jgi:hypothetical protein